MILAFDTTPDRTDTTPFPATLTKWKYRARPAIDGEAEPRQKPIMKTPNHFLRTAALARGIVAMMLAICIPAHGQNPVPPGTPAAAPQTEFQKWLADLDAQWQAAFKRDVSDAYTAENDKLRGQYVAALEAGLTKASGAGDLNAAIVWRSEQKRFAEANGIPAQDDAADPLAVKQLRAAWRSQLPRIETDRATRAKALLAKYDQVLAQAQTQLTQRNRLDDALLVKARRDEVAAAWLAGIPVTPPPEIVGEQPKPPTTVPIKPIFPANPNTPAAAFIDVAAELKTRGVPTDVVAGAITFDGPGGDGRGWSKGILIKNTPLTGKNGTTWSFTHIRQADGGVQIIHPHNRGQVIIHMSATEIGMSTPASWMEVGWGMGDQKRIKKGKGFSEIFPMKDAEEYHVLSKLDGQGGYELNINGKIVATGRVTTTSPLSIEIKPGLTYPGQKLPPLEFKGTDLPMKWEAGYAALIAVPTGGGTNLFREVRFSPSVKK